jgi:glutamine amidotransferase
VVVLDYGSGNIHSAVKALAAAGANVTLSSDTKDAVAADGLVVPGVGAFATVMSGLGMVGAAKIIDQRLTAGKKVLGICVGLQILFERGVEHGLITDGLGQLPGTVDLLDAPVLPHIGWNTVKAAEDSVLFEGVADERFYFVHSYAVQTWKLESQAPFPEPKITWSNYGVDFVAALEVGPLSATQFHPEKSGPAGIKLLSNWVNAL